MWFEFTVGRSVSSRVVGLGAVGAAILGVGSGALAADLAVPGDFPTIAAALDASADGDVILVEPGLVATGGEAFGVLPGHSVTIRSSQTFFPVLLDGQGVRRGFIAESPFTGEPAPTYRFEDIWFTRCEGIVTPRSQAWSPADQGAVVLAGYANVILDRCRVEDSALASANVFGEIDEASLVVRETEIRDSGAVAAGSFTASISMSDCTIRSCAAPGSMLTTSLGPVQLVRVEIIGCTAGDALVSGSDLDLEFVTVVGGAFGRLATVETFGSVDATAMSVEGAAIGAGFGGSTIDAVLREVDLMGCTGTLFQGEGSLIWSDSTVTNHDTGGEGLIVPISDGIDLDATGIELSDVTAAGATIVNCTFGSFRSSTIVGSDAAGLLSASDPFAGLDVSDCVISGNSTDVAVATGGGFIESSTICDSGPGPILSGNWCVDRRNSTLERSCGVPCPGDLIGDGVVDFDDLLGVLDEFGSESPCLADVVPDGVVGFSDLVATLSSWGDCG